MPLEAIQATPSEFSFSMGALLVAMCVDAVRSDKSANDDVSEKARMVIDSIFHKLDSGAGWSLPHGCFAVRCQHFFRAGSNFDRFPESLIFKAGEQSVLCSEALCRVFKPWKAKKGRGSVDTVFLETCFREVEGICEDMHSEGVSF